MVNLLLVGRGRTADVYEYEEGRILKLFKENLSHSGVHDEFSMSQAVYQLGVSTPQPIDMVHQDGRIGIIYERITGITMLHQLRSKPRHIFTLSKKMAKLHVELHKYCAYGMRSQEEYITQNIKQAPLLSIEEKARIIGYLENLTHSNRVCHGDFHPDNIIIDHKQDSWIIDWMTGMSGNPAGDVARSILLLKLGTLPEETPFLYKVLFAGIRKALTNFYTKHYLKDSIISYKEIDQWMLPIAAARLIEWIPEEEKRKLLTLIRNRLNTL